MRFAVADPEKAEAWYTANLNGNVGENPGRQFGHRTAYVEDPSGVRIELVEHAECAAGLASRESR